MASYISFNLEKRNEVTSGIARHNERKPGMKHSNNSIKDERTKDNIILNTSDLSYPKRINKIINEQHKTGRKVRKDAVKIITTTVELGGDIREKSEKEQVEFLKGAYEYLKNEYGAANIVHASIHVDETCPHLHFDFVPIKDGRLNAKKVVGNKKDMKTTQNKLLKSMQEQFPQHNFKRKNGTVKGLDRENWKVLQDEKARLEKEYKEKLSIEKELFRQEATEALKKFVKEEQEKIEQQKQDLENKRKELDEQEQKNKEKWQRSEAELQKRQRGVTIFEQELKDKEVNINTEAKIRRSELDEREKGVNSKENELNERERVLNDSQRKLVNYAEIFKKQHEELDNKKHFIDSKISEYNNMLEAGKMTTDYLDKEFNSLKSVKQEYNTSYEIGKQERLNRQIRFENSIDELNKGFEKRVRPRRLER